MNKKKREAQRVDALSPRAFLMRVLVLDGERHISVCAPQRGREKHKWKQLTASGDNKQ